MPDAFNTRRTIYFRTALILTSNYVYAHTIDNISMLIYSEMGQSLSEPKTEKETHSFENDSFVVGCSSMQGWRARILQNMILL